MQQLSGPQTATKPAQVDWPAVQPLADEASDAYARNMQATVLADYLISRHWDEGVNENGQHTRSTGLMLYINRRGGALVKGADGEDGVCFQYGCSLIQERSGGEWEAPFLECPNGNLQKVTCKSVAELSGKQEHVATRSAPPPAPPPPAPTTGPTPPFGTYLGNVSITMTSGGKRQQQPAKSELTLIDLGGGKVEVVTGACHFNSKRMGSTIRFDQGQTCMQGSTEAKDLKGTFKLLDGDQLDVALEMTVIARGQTSSLQTAGVLKLKR